MQILSFAVVAMVVMVGLITACGVYLVWADWRERHPVRRADREVLDFARTLMRESDRQGQLDEVRRRAEEDHGRHRQPTGAHPLVRPADQDATAIIPRIDPDATALIARVTADPDATAVMPRLADEYLTRPGSPGAYRPGRKPGKPTAEEA